MCNPASTGYLVHPGRRPPAPSARLPFAMSRHLPLWAFLRQRPRASSRHNILDVRGRNGSTPKSSPLPASSLHSLDNCAAPLSAPARCPDISSWAPPLPRARRGTAGHLLDFPGLLRRLLVSKPDGVRTATNQSARTSPGRPSTSHLGGTTTRGKGK